MRLTPARILANDVESMLSEGLSFFELLESDIVWSNVAFIRIILFAFYLCDFIQHRAAEFPRLAQISPVLSLEFILQRKSLNVLLGNILEGAVGAFRATGGYNHNFIVPSKDEFTLKIVSTCFTWSA